MIEDKDIFSKAKESVSPFLRLTDYLYMIRQNWLIGAVLGIILASICTLYLYSRIPSYRSSVQLFVELTPERILDVDQIVDTAAALNTGNASAILNHYLVELRSRKVLDYIISTLDKSMIERIIEPYRDPELAEPNVLNIIRKAIYTSLHLDNKVFTISVTHRDAAVTADLANFFATKYLEYNLKDLGSSNTSAQLFLNKNAKEIQDSIFRDQLELQRLQKKHNIISIEENRSITIDKITSLNRHLIGLNIEKQGFETILEQLKVRGIDIDTENESQITAALEIPEINQFAQIETIKAGLDQALIAQKQIELVYLEKHPEYIQNKKHTTELRSQLRTDISLAIKSLVTKSEKIVAQMDKIKTNIEELEDEAKRLDNLSITLLSLQMKINNNKSTLAEIESRINETIISSQLSKASMKILDDAVKPSKPHYPNNKHTITIGIFLFILGFTGLPLGIGFINNKLRTSWDVEELIDKPLLGEIENLGKEYGPNMHKLVTQSELENNPIVDTFRSIYKNIRLNTSNVDRKIQVITSAMPNEGKTTFALNYAATCVQHQKRALLIDFDLRKPQIQDYTKTKTDTDTGLVDWFSHEAELPTNDQLHEMLGIHLLDSGVYLLPAGKATNHATELAESRKFRQLVLKLSDQFDYVILDTPPLTTFPDVMFIADCAQDIIFLCKYNYVNKILVKQLIERLDKTAASVCGVIINQSKTKGHSKDYYGYYYGQKY